MPSIREPYPNLPSLKLTVLHLKMGPLGKKEILIWKPSFLGVMLVLGRVLSFYHTLSWYGTVQENKCLSIIDLIDFLNQLTSPWLFSSYPP